MELNYSGVQWWIKPNFGNKLIISETICQRKTGKQLWYHIFGSISSVFGTVVPSWYLGMQRNTKKTNATNNNYAHFKIFVVSFVQSDISNEVSGNGCGGLCRTQRALQNYFFWGKEICIWFGKVFSLPPIWLHVVKEWDLARRCDLNRVSVVCCET